MNPEKTFPFNQEFAWHPTLESQENSNINALMQKTGCKSYDELYRYSVADIGLYWDLVLQDMEIKFDHPYSNILDLSGGKPFPKWCVDGRMNIYDSCLTQWIEKGFGKQNALIYEDENGKIVTYSYEKLDREASALASAMKEIGLGKGDSIALYMPMNPEIAVAFMAIIKIGAVILPLFSGYGPSAIATRLNDGKAKVVFATDFSYRRGKTVNMMHNLQEALNDTASVEHVIINYRGSEAFKTSNKAINIIDYHEFINRPVSPTATEIVGAEDMVMLIYTSGTTGRPKGAVHSHCGFPLKAAHDLRYHFNLKQRDVLYWMTDMGWMMGPWEVFGTLILGATMVFYEGAPDFPDVDRQWELVEKHHVTHLGVSPNLVRSLMVHGTEPTQRHDLTSIELAGSTGSPWDPESWRWFFENILHSSKPIMNYSGGTEISGGIICGNLYKSLKPCAFSGPMLGMDVDVVDEEGKPLRNAVGELIIRQPWLGMTMAFWGDKDRYLESYWQTFDDVWRHGDFAAIDEDGLYYILGRSDDTIKISGKRLGPAEVESILNRHEAVSESAAIAVPHPVKDNEVVAFCVLSPGNSPSEELREELVSLVTGELGKPLKPKEMRFTEKLPKTRNAKIMRRLIRAVYLDLPTGDASNMEDPSALKAIRESI